MGCRVGPVDLVRAGIESRIPFGYSATLSQRTKRLMQHKKLVLISLIVGGSVGCDQATKVLARQHLDGSAGYSFLGNTIRLTYTENTGAFLGMGSSLPPGIRMAIFVVFVALLLTGLLIWLLRTSPISNPAVVATSLFIGGGVGNLIDRIRFEGGVTDFMNLGIGGVRTGVFNAADVFIVAGFAVFLFAPEFRKKPPSSDSAEEKSDEEPLSESS